jgi:hypothetical protein
MRFALLLVCASMSFGSVACSSVQVVQQSPRGGTLSLHGPAEGAREKADDYMNAQCPFGYRVVRETEETLRYECKEPDQPRQSPSSQAKRREAALHI